jgi:hypothetical protein
MKSQAAELAYCAKTFPLTNGGLSEFWLNNVKSLI